MAGRTWTIELPPGTPIISANNRLHWAARNARVQNLKAVVEGLARMQRIPVLTGASVTVTYSSPPRWRKLRHPLASDMISDHDNLYPTGKALVDGLVHAGVLPGDSRKHVAPPHCEIAPGRHPMGQVVLRITELASVAGLPVREAP